jgi:hypothetical protein
VFYYLDPPVVNVEILPGPENELGKKKMFLFYFFLAYMIFRNQLTSFLLFNLGKTQGGMKVSDKYYAFRGSFVPWNVVTSFYFLKRLKPAHNKKS